MSSYSTLRETVYFGHIGLTGVGFCFDNYEPCPTLLFSQRYMIGETKWNTIPDSERVISLLRTWHAVSCSTLRTFPSPPKQKKIWKLGSRKLHAHEERDLSYDCSLVGIGDGGQEQAWKIEQAAYKQLAWLSWACLHQRLPRRKWITVQRWGKALPH